MTTRDHSSSLIVVSNREPYEHVWRKGQLVCRPTDGGLSSALDPILRRVGGLWVAWGSGEGDREATGGAPAIDVPPEAPAYRLRRVWLAQEEVKGGYLGYANEVLWPLCHVTLDRVAYHRAFWEPYANLNRRFADAVLEEIKEHAVPVWVHDFHLSLVPRLVKADAPHIPISVFWHVPWPAPDVFRILPERTEILEGLLAADSIVFQTPSYGLAFCECAKKFLQADIDSQGHIVTWQGHRTSVTARAISVDFEAFSSRAKTASVERLMALARRRLKAHPGVRIGLGVDRLDYTKGLLKRLWALDAFFTRYPEFRGTFTFVQVAVPTRSELEAYRRYRKLIWQTVFEVNDRHSMARQSPSQPSLLQSHAPVRDPRLGYDGHDSDQRHEQSDEEIDAWRPIEYLEGKIDFDTLVAYYRLADLALVSSVYDGMNLVAKEYIASQVDEAGVLLVSQMAGSADELTDALIINPYDPDGLADAIRDALVMPDAERRRRMRAMRAHLTAHDLYAWADGCLRDAGLALGRRLAE